MCHPPTSIMAIGAFADFPSQQADATVKASAAGRPQRDTGNRREAITNGFDCQQATGILPPISCHNIFIAKVCL